ncbi:SCO-spondin-like isoform X2 [Bolinopsis microptera]|uniref:SCO-spondin-like isoform X2 n=1 Tax=Bolinopsis microptera TaxID=2820187 RepID=UPI00307A0EA6
MSTGFLSALFAVLLISVEAQRCRYSADKLPSKIVKYNKCLSIGYEPSIEGCVKQETDKKLRRNDKKKCAEMEKYLMKCGHTCDTDGGYSDFGEWSECDAECDGGTQARTRQCDNPAPVGNGAECQGDSSESRECNLNPCPVDGGYSDFGDWSECSAECDGGMQSRTRECNNPAPQHGGEDCEGEESESQECNEHDCLECEDPNSFYNQCGSSCNQTCDESCEEPIVVHDSQFVSVNFEGEEEECVKRCECDDGYVLHEGECIEEAVCPVDGGYSDFGDWSECSAECDGGNRTRTRQCNNPAPAHGGAECEGEESEIEICNAHNCLECEDPNSFYNQCGSSCNQTCDESCEEPIVVHDNQFVSFNFGGEEEECVKRCECDDGYVLHEGECIEEAVCPVDGGYSDFGDWSECSAECDGGNRTRTRQCNNPAPAHGGAECEGEDSEIEICNAQDCLECEDPNSFYNQCGSSCNQTCDKSCEEPIVVHDSQFVSFNFGGEEEECVKRCECDDGYVLHEGECIEEAFCPVDGGYSDFGDWSECSAECDGGNRTRTRQCNNPAPAHGGAECEGEESEIEICNAHDCLECEDPNSFYNQCGSSCNQTCDESCEEPIVVHDSQFVSFNFGGEEEECVKRCECDDGYVLHEGECIEEAFCPVHGGYSDFEDWSECSAECDGGMQSRTRECNNPAPQHGGEDCEGEESESRECNTDPCPVHGGYSDFGDWSECSAECDGGMQSRTRECNNPAPQHGGEDCEGEESESRECNTDPCPVHGGYSDFGDWSECSAGCDGGMQSRTRECNNPAPQHGGEDCEGEASESRECNTDPCPVHGGYSDFGDWSECSAECDGGMESRTRECNNPAPQHGGEDCEGEESESRECNTDSCPVHGGYSDFGDWSECSAECDGGMQSRNRECNNPAPQHGGEDCEGEASESQECNTQACAVSAVDGMYGEFGDWSECADECGGTQSRTRECDSPVPENGGAECEGEAEETQDCPACRQLTAVYAESTDLLNIASSGTASQSNSAYKGVAELAIDGNTNGDFEQGSVTHTRTPGEDTFWKLEFDTPRYIDNVVIWGRSDCCQKRIDGAKFSIDNVGMGKLYASRMPEDKKSYEVNSFAKEILIKGSKGKLSLAEVQVFGREFEFNNIAEEAEVSGSGESQQEFTWDMPRHINSIVLNYNEDAKFDVEGTSVFVGDTEVGQVEAEDEKFTYIFGGMEGKHSSVRIIGDLLSLDSVEIYGE